CQHQYGNARTSPDTSKHIEAIRPWQHHVEHHQVVLVGKSTIDATLSVVNGFHGVAFGLQILAHQFAKADVVIDDQNAFHRLFEVIQMHISTKGQAQIRFPCVNVAHEVSITSRY